MQISEDFLALPMEPYPEFSEEKSLSFSQGQWTRNSNSLQETLEQKHFVTSWGKEQKFKRRICRSISRKLAGKPKVLAKKFFDKVKTVEIKLVVFGTELSKLLLRSFLIKSQFLKQLFHLTDEKSFPVLL